MPQRNDNNFPDQAEISKMLMTNTKAQKKRKNAPAVSQGQDDAPPESVYIEDIVLEDNYADHSEVQKNISILDKTELKKPDDEKSSILNMSGQPREHPHKEKVMLSTNLNQNRKLDIETLTKGKI